MTRATLERLLQEYLQVTGDILYAGGAAASTFRRVARLGVGAAGEVLTVAGGVPTWAPAAGGIAPNTARAYHNVNQAVGAGVRTVLALNSELWDTGGFHDLALNNSRMTITNAGKYYVGANALFNGVINARCLLEIWVNGIVAGNYYAVQEQSSPLFNEVQINVNCLLDLATGNYVEAAVWVSVAATIRSVNYITPHLWIVGPLE